MRFSFRKRERLALPNTSPSHTRGTILSPRACKELFDLRLVLPNPDEHGTTERVRWYRTPTKRRYHGEDGDYSPGEHECELEDSPRWGCAAWAMYLDGGAYHWVERTWKGLESFLATMEELGNPAEMRAQWRLLVDQALALGAAHKEAADLAASYTQAVEDAALLDEGSNPYQDPSVREVAAAQVRLQAIIATGVTSIETTAAAAVKAAAAKRRAEEMANAMLRRSTGGYTSSEGAAQVTHLAEILSQQVTSLTSFTEELEASTRHLAPKELAS